MGLPIRQDSRRLRALKLPSASSGSHFLAFDSYTGLASKSSRGEGHRKTASAVSRWMLLGVFLYSFSISWVVCPEASRFSARIAGNPTYGTVRIEVIIPAQFPLHYRE